MEMKRENHVETGGVGPGYSVIYGLGLSQKSG